MLFGQKSLCSFKRALTISFDISCNGVASPKIWGRSKILGGLNVDFRRVTVFFFGTPLLEHQMTRYTKIWEVPWSPSPPRYAYDITRLWHASHLLETFVLLNTVQRYSRHYTTLRNILPGIYVWNPSAVKVYLKSRSTAS